VNILQTERFELRSYILQDTRSSADADRARHASR